jgi:hypothetical protein
MEDLRKLLEERKFQEVLDLTRKSTKSEELFFRLSAFMALGKLKEAIDCIEVNRVTLQDNLPWLMRLHIELLCLDGRFDEAFDEVKYYENLPYDSQESEEVLKTLPKIIREYETSKSHLAMEKEEIIKGLASKSSDDVLASLDALRDKDLTPYYIFLQKILTSFPKQAIRSFALLLLVQRAVNKTFKFNNMGETIDVNPSLLKPPFVDDDFEKVVKRMEEEYKDPSITQNAISLLSSYLIYIYPKTVDLNDDVLVDALYHLSCEYLQIDTSIPSKAIGERVRLIGDILSDF